MSQESGETRKSVTEHTVELRHLCKEFRELQLEVKGLRADIHDRWPQCSVHEERINKLEASLGQRTTGGILGILALVGYAIQDFMRR